MENIVSPLFPEQNGAVIPFITAPTIEGFIPISEEELLNAGNKMNYNKASEPDIPNVAVKAAIKTEPELFVSLHNQCLLKESFPRAGKKQKLVLLLKPVKQAE